LTIYFWIILVAILVTWVNPDPSNPIVQFLNRMTVPLWEWVRGKVPYSLQNFSAYIALLLVIFLGIFIPGLFITLAGMSSGEVATSQAPGILSGYFLLGLGSVAQQLLGFLILLLLIWFFLTLINPSVNNPIVRTIYILVDPFITPIQKRLPRQRIDFSPLIAAGIFLLLNLFVVSGLMAFANELIVGGNLVDSMNRLLPLNR
jgi:YggT family protein